MELGTKFLNQFHLILYRSPIAIFYVEVPPRLGMSSQVEISDEHFLYFQRCTSIHVSLQIS